MQWVQDIGGKTIVKKKPKDVVAVVSGCLKPYFCFVLGGGAGLDSLQQLAESSFALKLSQQKKAMTAPVRGIMAFFQRSRIDCGCSFQVSYVVGLLAPKRQTCPREFTIIPKTQSYLKDQLQYITSVQLCNLEVSSRAGSGTGRLLALQLL